MSSKQSRKTARRKMRQELALAKLRKKFPGAAVATTRLGTVIQVTSPRMLTQRGKHHLVQALARGLLG